RPRCAVLRLRLWRGVFKLRQHGQELALFDLEAVAWRRWNYARVIRKLPVDRQRCEFTLPGQRANPLTVVVERPALDRGHDPAGLGRDDHSPPFARGRNSRVGDDQPMSVGRDCAQLATYHREVDTPEVTARSFYADGNRYLLENAFARPGV